MTVAIEPLLLDRAIERADACSPFLRQSMRLRPDVTESLARNGLTATLAAAEAAARDDSDVARALRRERQVVALAIALADLAGA
jgi:glutamate-ammonia-ligase adenylyltransferase